MKQQPTPLAQENQYFLTRVKDTHEESGMKFITLFARVTQGPYTTGSSPSDVGSESLWVYIDEVREDGAPSKIRSMRNGAFTFSISREVAGEILNLSTEQPHQLWLVTPFHRTSHFRAF